MENVLRDPHFEQGFLLKGLNSLRDGHGSIREFRFSDRLPAWYLCQWNSRYDLVTADCVRNGSDFEIGDVSKRLSGHGGALTFRLDASKEFDAPRGQNDPWPHLLIEQDIAPVPVGTLRHLVLSGKFTLTHFADRMGEAKREYHAAQFVWVVVLANKNPDSPDCGHFMWVVLGLFDSRYDFPPLFCAQDKALPDGEFIYSFDARTYLDAPMSDGKEHAISLDLVPCVGMMLATAKKGGFLTDTKLGDLALVSTNMGFEVPGTFDIEMRARDIAISLG